MMLSSNFQINFIFRENRKKMEKYDFYSYFFKLSDKLNSSNLETQ